MQWSGGAMLATIAHKEEGDWRIDTSSHSVSGALLATNL